MVTFGMALNMELLGLGHKREGQDVHTVGAGRLEDLGAGFERRPGRAHIIDENEGAPLDEAQATVRNGESIAHIALALFVVEPGLRWRRALPAQQLGTEGLVRGMADLPGEQRRLVVAP